MSPLARVSLCFIVFRRICYFQFCANNSLYHKSFLVAVFISFAYGTLKLPGGRQTSRFFSPKKSRQSLDKVSVGCSITPCENNISENMMAACFSFCSRLDTAHKISLLLVEKNKAFSVKM